MSAPPERLASALASRYRIERELGDGWREIAEASLCQWSPE
ncbi:MAG: hypothetical protein ABI836_05315 [Gemmatimonadota bacterium]